MGLFKKHSHLVSEQDEQHEPSDLITSFLWAHAYLLPRRSTPTPGVDQPSAQCLGLESTCTSRAVKAKIKVQEETPAASADN